MRRRLPPFLRNLALFVALLSALPSAVAEAQEPRRIVVENFRGPAAGRVRSHLLANLQRQDDLEVVARSEVRATARELGISGSNYSQDEYAQIAREMNVTAFVDGRTNRRRRRWALTVRVRSGADGTILGSESWGGRTVGSLGAIRRNGYARLEPHITAAPSPAPQNDTTITGVTEIAASGDTPWYATGGSQDDESVLDLDPDEDEDFDDPVASDQRQDALRIAFVGGSVRRSMTARACVRPSVTVGGMSFTRNPADHESCSASGDLFEERTYESGGLGHFEAGIEGELYPGALGDGQLVPWLGVVASFRHSLFLSSFGFDRNGEQIEVPTTQSELYLGAIGRYRLTPAPNDLEATAEVGYGLFSFELDVDALKQLEPSAVIPPVSYQYLSLGVGLSYQLVPTYLRMGADVAWRLGLGVGREAKEVWGVETTDMSGFGLGLHLISEIPEIFDGFFAGFSFEYFRFTTTYRGQTACIDDCADEGIWEPWPHQDGDEEAVTGGITDPVADDYVRLTLKVGYALD